MSATDSFEFVVDAERSQNLRGQRAWLKYVACLSALALVLWAAVWWFRGRESRAAVDVVKAHLFDPYSAQFTEVEHFPASGATCGVVNAKNRMGAYIGRTAFILADNEVAFVPPDYDRSAPAKEQVAALQALIQWQEKAIKHCPGWHNIH
jgi:hypothetical protein